MRRSRDEFHPITITRLPHTDWVEPRQQSKTVIQPWDFETRVSGNTVLDGSNLTIGRSRDEALLAALGNEAVWDTFTDAVSLVITDKNLNS